MMTRHVDRVAVVYFFEAFDLPNTKRTVTRFYPLRWRETCRYMDGPLSLESTLPLLDIMGRSSSELIWIKLNKSTRVGSLEMK